MIPIEKNIIVTDVNGIEIGATYPKRAKGLVKNGRAEYTDDHRIRLKFTHASAVDINTEEFNMSKVIDFNAREFKFDETCQSLDGSDTNAGMRGFVTLSFGNAEVWEIGDRCWTWSQICCEKKLEKNTDYVFRFSLEGGVCDTDDAVAIAHIAPKRKWEDRYSFLLDHNKFMPVICKRDGEGLLRVFELPFNTGDDEDWKIYLVAQHAVTRYFAPVDISVIKDLPDISYDEWWNECRQKKQAGGTSGNTSDNACDGINMAVDSQEFDESGFAVWLSKISDNCNVGFENVTVHSGARGELTVGPCTDSSNFGFENCTLTSRAMSMIIAKLGDDCNAGFENVTVTIEGIDDMLDIGKKVNNVNIAFENVTIPQKVLDLIHLKMGNDCNLATSNCTAG